jgi:hypothetical protein
MIGDEVRLAERRLRTPRAAAVAGILFAVLFSISIVLIRLATPADLSAGAAWLESELGRVRLALGLMPFAGIAFLWFVGVVRDRLGAFEDQFFSTVFFGSGLLFLAMVFAASAIAGGLVIGSAGGLSQDEADDVYLFGRAVMSQIFNVYGIRMAGVFAMSLGTIWFRTGVMPRWLAFVTLLVALTLLLIVSLNLWVVLIFPGWVFLISVAILVSSLRGQTAGAEDVLSSGEV